MGNATKINFMASRNDIGLINKFSFKKFIWWHIPGESLVYSASENMGSTIGVILSEIHMGPVCMHVCALG